MNVIVIISDTFRRDRLSCYRDRTTSRSNTLDQSGRRTWRDAVAWTPNLDRLAAQSTIFERHYAASFPTMPARADLLTGKWTFAYMTWEPLPRTEISLAQVLTLAGFATAGVVDTPFYQMNGFGYDRDFQYFYDLHSQRPMSILMPQPRTYEDEHCAPRTFTLAEHALEYLYKKPFMLWVDTWDPHEPWDPPSWHAKRYKPDYDGKVVAPTYCRYQDAGLTEDDIETARACYMGEITMVDRYVGRLLERVESLGISEQTAIIFTTDHGFHFGEHGGLFGKMLRPMTFERKGTLSRQPGFYAEWLRSPLYEEVAHIPLLIYIPGVAPRRVLALVSAIDIMPTVLELAGVALPDGLTIQGRSLVPMVRGEETKGRDFVPTTMPLVNPGEEVRVVDSLFRTVKEFQPVTLTTTEWSLLYSAQGEPVELYHLPTDPYQEHNVANQNASVVEDIHSQYVKLLKEMNTKAEYLGPRSSL